MSIQIFPHFFKYIFFVIVVITSVLSGGDDFMDGYKAGRSNYPYNYYDKPENVALKTHYFKDLIGGEYNQRIITIISILGLLGYVMTKERVEDDYIKFLRLSSYQWAFFIILLIGFIFYLANFNFKNGIGDTMTLFLLLYLIVFAIKKRIA